MTDKSKAFAVDAADHRDAARQEPELSETAGEEPRVSRSAWRWAIAVVVMTLVVYPITDRVIGGVGVAAGAQLTAGANELQLSLQHYQAGRYQDAISAAKAAIAANPNSADAYNNLAVSYMGLHEIDQAIQAAQEAIRIQPDHQLAKNNLAWFQGEKAQAAQAAQASTLLNQSLQHYQAGRFRECIDTATESAKLNPNSAQAFNNIGICAANLKLWNDAITNAKQALRLDPNFQLAKNNLVWMQQQMVQAGAANVP